MDFVRSLRAIAVATVTALTFAAPARAQTAELKVSHFLPPIDTFQKAMEA
jgi:hypothetical protein